MQQTAIRILEAAFVGYPVVDVNRARQFYESVLHLTPSMQFIENGKAWIEYTLNDGAVLAITNINEAWKPGTNGPSLALEVEDFEQAIQALRAEKTLFYLEPFETPVCHMAVIGDTEGNKLIIHKRK